MGAPTRVYLEVGTRRVFAAALDWPGWCRAGRDEAAALEALAGYADRYRTVADGAGIAFDSPGAFVVVERLEGSATTDFGAPGALPAADRAPVGADEAQRLATLVAAAWRALDGAAATALEVLRKGPRGGGRDRDAVVAHVVESEQGYARHLGVTARHARGTGADAVAARRRAVLAALTAGQPRPGDRWPARYAARRFAWHALDHAWEIEDRAPS